jgi:hypothetical protein
MAIDPTGLVDKIISWLPANCQQEAREGRKAVVAGMGALISVLTLVSTRFGFLLPENVKKPVAIALSILTAAMVWLVPNEHAV